MTTPMTSAGKEALRKTVRGLREALISELKEEAERVYRLGVSLSSARLSEANAKRRARLEEWVEEQGRADFAGAGAGAGGGGKKAGKKGAPAGGERKKPSEKQLKELRDRYLGQAVKEAAHTLLNRLVILRLMEAGKLIAPAVVSGGRKSPAYVEFQNYAAALCRDPKDSTGGYQTLLQLVFDDLSVELPGVFGKVGLTSLFPVPGALLWEAVEALNDPALDSVWSDDTTLGWVYQFWNDPEREALDDKINGGGKIEPHEIASKTQMFTERYMVEWLLQNSLGQTWLAMCKKRGFTPEFESVRESLDARRAEWRRKREAGEVAPDELMPIGRAGPDGDLEHQWKYWVPQPLPEDAPEAAPERLLDLKLLDPACGSGHFLVIAFEMLSALYCEEARAQGEEPEPVVIATDILEHNLHGVDIDPRAIQIAAAALWLKAQVWVKAQDKHERLWITRLNLVAPTFKLAGLPADDPALLELKKRLKVEVGIPESLTDSLVGALSGVDHLGTLLRVDKNVRAALSAYEEENFGLSKPAAQLGMYGEEPKTKVKLSLDEAEANVTEQLARFLDAHEGESDLGLRLEGEQLQAGVRFLQIVREGTFDVVVGNPPYQGTSKMAEADWFKKHYPRSKADLYACFLERGLELAKPGGVSALLTMRGWMFLSSYQELREGLLKENELSVLGDIDRGGFADIPDEVVAASMTVFAKRRSEQHKSVAIQPTPLEDKSRDSGRTSRKKAALLAQVGRFEFDVAKLSGIEGTPLVYWWSEEFLEEYVKAPKLGEVAPVKQGSSTTNNGRFLRKAFEVEPFSTMTHFASETSTYQASWVPYVLGASGRRWCEPLSDLVRWAANRLELRAADAVIRNPDYHFKQGVAYSTIGSDFSGRAHRFPSVFSDKGASVFSDDTAGVVCLMNTWRAAQYLNSLNPTVSYQVGDINRLPVAPDPAAGDIYVRIRNAFTLHESHREPSVEFKQPGPSPWRAAQDWAQRAVDRPKGEPLPPYEEELDPPDPIAFVSFAIGVALGRFGENGEGILDLSLSGGHDVDRQATPEDASAQREVLRGAPSTAADQVGGAGAHAEGGEEEPGFTPGDGGGLYPLENQPSGAQTKALLSETGQSLTGAKTSKSGLSAHFEAHASEKVQNSTISESASRKANSAQRNPGSIPLDVPNIQPSPPPPGQVILPDGILFVAAAPQVQDSSGHPAFERIAEAWTEHGRTVTDGKTDSLGEWLRKEFFAYHKSLYENRPIYFPLTSAGKSFVAWVSIHRWTDSTLQSLLAHHLHPAREKLQGEINDLNQARASSDKKAQATAEKQYAKTQKLFEELEAFISDVTQIAEKGAPPTDVGGKNACPPREADAPFRMDLDDGVMINSAALWPLLEPQWKDPKKWWKELCTADGRKDYDWAHLAARYFPTRVDKKCKEDPSLGVAHGCFWKYHPAKAYAWELRLQDEIGPEFTIDEAFPQMPTAGDPRAVAGELQAGWFGPPGPRAASDKYREEFLREHPETAAEIRAKEEQRRERNRKKAERGEAEAEGSGDQDDAEQGRFALRAE